MNIKPVLIPLLLLIMGCNGGDEHGHAHDEEGISYTILSDSMELFVEFRPLIVGHLTSFAAHLTILEDYKSLEQGTLTVSLVKDNKGIRNTVDEPRSPGIFTPALKPAEAGVYSLIFEVASNGMHEQFIIKNIPVFSRPEEAATYDFSEADKEGEVTFLKEQAWKNEFGIEIVAMRPVHQVIRTSGEILPAQTAETMLVANGSGVVSLNDNATVGSAVNSGEVVFTISSSGMTGTDNLNSGIAVARAAFNEAKSNYERGAELAEERLITQQELERRQREFETARANLNALTGNNSSAGQQVKSPHTGFISELMVRDGQFVNAGDPLARVLKNQKLQLRAKVGQQHYSSLASIENAGIKTPISKSMLYLNDLNGSLKSYGRTVGNDIFIPVIMEMDNHPFLVPGSFAEIWLQVAPARDVLAIPVTAVLEEYENYFVYVMESGESFSKREITRGSSDGQYMEILSGLAAGEVIVIKGTYLIKMASMSSSIPAHGHEH